MATTTSDLSGGVPKPLGKTVKRTAPKVAVNPAPRAAVRPMKGKK